ncbi:MAG: alpha/beta hydrolase [Candidatus Melainabacteria bacterium]|nr:alpha/beta hydrolase [Candidatus Melainabacteria bacterium]
MSALLLPGGAPAVELEADAAARGQLRRLLKAGRSLPSDITVKRDLAYGKDPAQRIDVYIPQGAKNAPVIFMVHGGAWMIGDKGNKGVVDNKVKRWGPQGFVFISANYRLFPAADPLEQARDVARALAFAQSRATSFGASPDSFILMGHSAGAHLVSLISADRSLATNEGARAWLGTISLDSAAMDVVSRMKEPHQGFFDKAFGSDPEYWKSTSPLYRLSVAPPPMLLVCSSRRQNSCQQARDFAARAGELGGRVQVLTQPLSHGQINNNLGAPSDYTDEVERFIKSLLSI